LDFSKAFDHIDHNILVKKLIDLGLRRSLIACLCSFLSDRRQAVKLNSLISDWELCRAVIPQGTKLGPILFAIMINDLAVKSPLTADRWKFVDDVTLSELVVKLRLNQFPFYRPTSIIFRHGRKITT
jgi:hypothetical protein